MQQADRSGAEPPTPERDRLHRLRLLRSRRVGPVTYRRLVAEHGCAGSALAALPAIAAEAGIADYAPFSDEAARAEARLAKRAGARGLFEGDPAWPAALAGIDDAPPFLWCRGDVTLLARPCVAIVGARGASSLGLRMAKRLASDLSRSGFTVVSGLARGIDAAAHEGALSGGTVAVTGGGVDVPYPPETEALMGRIADHGLILSEQPMGLAPRARHFPARNRIVSALCRGVVVVEAAARSGTLITARCAADQGREVLAVPGHPFDGRASGCNALLRDGATLVRGAEDVIEALGDPLEPARDACGACPEPANEAPVRPAHETGPPLAARIIGLLGPSPTSEDQVIRDSGADAAAVAAQLTTLEIEGVVERRPGGLLALA